MSVFFRTFSFASRRPICSLSRFSLRQFSGESGSATPPPPPPPSPGAAETGTTESPEVAIAALNTKITELKDLLLRQMAETENVRKQGQNLVEDAKKYGVQSLLKDLIGVFDTLDIVLENTRVGHQATAEELKRDFAAFHEAVMVLEKDLLKSLSKHGVNKFSPHGEDFNPNMHNALYQAPHEELPKNKVLKVHKPGFALHNRVLRPAQVGVSTGVQKKD